MKNKVIMIVKKGWENSGRIGIRIGNDYQSQDGVWWTPIQWLDEEDPDFHKKDGLEWVKSDYSGDETLEQNKEPK